MTDDEMIEQQAKALHDAAVASPVRQFRDELRVRAKEWDRAAEDLEETEDDGTVELAGSVTAGMRVWQRAAGEPQFLPVMGGARSGALMLENPHTGQPIYRNVFSASSPVVVQR